MKKIYTENYKIAHPDDPFSPDERSYARMQDFKEKASGFGKAVAEPAANIGKGLWEVAKYMGRGYAPFDIKDIVERQFSNSDYSSGDKLSKFKKLVKDNENKTIEDVENLSNIKERELMSQLLSNDPIVRSKIFDELKEELEINDKELYEIVSKLFKKT